MSGEYQNAESVGITGSADGPTSILIVGKKAKIPFKVRINKYIYKYKRKKSEKKIVAGAHTLEELVAFAADNYGATEVNKKQGEFPAASRIYEIKAGNNCLEIEIDYTRDTLGVSFSGSKKTMKHFRKTAKDLYIYYGVSENDISKKTERYLSLSDILSI